MGSRVIFSANELRLIRDSIDQTARHLNKRITMLYPESEDAIEVRNDLLLCHTILQKLKEHEDC